MKRGKKSQGNILVIVLIILLVLAVIVVVWKVVRNTVTESSEQVSTLPFTIELKASSIPYLVNGCVYINIKRDPGEGKIEKIRFIFETSSGEQEDYIEENEANFPKELESREFVFCINEITRIDIDDIIKVSFVPIFENEVYGIVEEETILDICQDVVNCIDNDDLCCPTSCDYNNDNDCPQLTCTDVDGDGYCSESSSSGCDNSVCPIDYDDCNDGNDLINPGASEVCWGELDEDCDGLVDAEDVDDCGGCSGTVSYAITGTETCINQYSSTYSCDRASNSVTSDYWFGLSTGTPKWVYGDLGSKKCISGVKVYISNLDVPQTMDIQVSDDAVSWTTVANGWTVTTGETWVEKTFTETQGRYVRFYMTSCARAYCNFRDFEIKSRSYLG